MIYCQMESTSEKYTLKKTDAAKVSYSFVVNLFSLPTDFGMMF